MLEAEQLTKLFLPDVGVIKDVDHATRRIKARISQPHIDRGGEKMDQDDVANCMPAFFKRGIIAYQHLWWAGAVIGAPTEDWGRADDGSVWNVARIGKNFHVPTPFGKIHIDDLWEQMDQRILRNTSLGGLGKVERPDPDDDNNEDKTPIVHMRDLWEWSVVPIGAAHDARIDEVMVAAGLWPGSDSDKKRLEQALGRLSVEQLSAIFDNARRTLSAEVLSLDATSDLFRSVEKRLVALNREG